MWTPSDAEVARATVIGAVTSTIISIAALIYTVRAFWLKSGINIRSALVPTSGYNSDVPYISSFMLENLKDKAVVIFDVHLKMGPSCYVRLIEYGTPLILQPFTIHQEILGPIEFYASNMTKISRKSLFNSTEDFFKAKVILSTADGKYVSKARVKRWWPLKEYFSSVFASIVYPESVSYNGRPYGNAKYLIEIMDTFGKTDLIPIQRDSDNIMVKGLVLSKAVLNTPGDIEAFFTLMCMQSKIAYSSLNVIDFDVQRKKRDETYQSEKDMLWDVSPFAYHIVGRLVSNWHEVQIRRENKRAAKKKTDDG